MKTIKIFLASSSELLEDRRAFEIFLNRRNKTLIKEGIFLELVIWEDFLDVLSKTRLQDEYNKVLKQCDLFVMLFYTKVGKYTEEEFNTAYQEFMANDKPLIFTYFKDALGDIKPEQSLLAFKDRLSQLGHFFTVYKNIEGLQLHFMEQLEKLETKGIISNEPKKEEEPIQKPAPKPDLIILDKIKAKIASGMDLSKILITHGKELSVLAKDLDGIDDELLILQGKATKLDKDIRRSMISGSDAGVKRNQYVLSFFAILDEIKNAAS